MIDPQRIRSKAIASASSIVGKRKLTQTEREDIYVKCVKEACQKLGVSDEEYDKACKAEDAEMDLDFENY